MHRLENRIKQLEKLFDLKSEKSGILFEDLFQNEITIVTNKTTRTYKNLSARDSLERFRREFSTNIEPELIFRLKPLTDDSPIARMLKLKAEQKDGN